MGLAHTDSRRYVAHVLNALLGGGMSSWLFQEIREKRGKAYSVYSFLSSFWDTGYLAVYAGTHPDWVKEVVNLILAGMRNFAEGKITQEEVDRGKNQLIGNTILGLESTDSWMSQLARNEIYFGKVVSVEENHARRSFGDPGRGRGPGPGDPATAADDFDPPGESQGRIHRSEVLGSFPVAFETGLWKRWRSRSRESGTREKKRRCRLT